MRENFFFLLLASKRILVINRKWKSFCKFDLQFCFNDDTDAKLASFHEFIVFCLEDFITKIIHTSISAQYLLIVFNRSCVDCNSAFRLEIYPKSKNLKFNTFY